MSVKILGANIFWELDDLSIEQAIAFLSKYPIHAKIESYFYFDEAVIKVFIEEPREEKAARLAAEKAAREADNIEKERKRYLELKAKFEPEV